jgi:hypothetical protein
MEQWTNVKTPPETKVSHKEFQKFSPPPVTCAEVLKKAGVRIKLPRLEALSFDGITLMPIVFSQSNLLVTHQPNDLWTDMPLGLICRDQSYQTFLLSPDTLLTIRLLISLEKGNMTIYVHKNAQDVSGKTNYRSFPSLNGLSILSSD